MLQFDSKFIANGVLIFLVTAFVLWVSVIFVKDHTEQKIIVNWANGLQQQLNQQAQQQRPPQAQALPQAEKGEKK